MRHIYWKKPLRVGGIFVSGTACALAISGCVFANNLSPVEVSVVGGQVTMAFCESGTVESIRVEQRPSGSADQWQTVWQGDGEYPVHAGDVLKLDGSVEGFVGGGTGILDVSEGAKYGLVVVYSSKRAGREPVVYEPTFDSPRGGLAEGVWLDYQGGASQSPCG